MKKLMAAFILGAFLVSVGIGCGGPSTPTKTEKPKEPEKPKTGN